MTNYTVKATVRKYFNITAEEIMADVKDNEVIFEETFMANKLYADAVWTEHVDYNEFFNFADMTKDEIEKLKWGKMGNIEITLEAYDNEGNLCGKSTVGKYRAYVIWTGFRNETEPAHFSELFVNEMEGKLVTKKEGRA